MSTLLSQESNHSICSRVSNFPFLIFSYILKVLDLSSLVHFNFSFSLNNFGLSFTCLHALLCLLLLSSVSVFHVIAGHQLPPTSFLIAYNALTSSSNSWWTNGFCPGLNFTQEFYIIPYTVSWHELGLEQPKSPGKCAAKWYYPPRRSVTEVYKPWLLFFWVQWLNKNGSSSPFKFPCGCEKNA